MNDLYDHPEYYDIAFGFRDLKAEVDVFEQCFAEFSDIPVNMVLELGSGNSPHMPEFSKRGYLYTGLDLNQRMLDHSSAAAAKSGINAFFVKADMLNFTMKSKADFVYVMLGSLSPKSNQDLKNHLKSVADALKTGGLYFLDWCIQYSPWDAVGEDSWQAEHMGVRLSVTVNWSAVNPVEQLFRETISVNGEDNGKLINLISEDIKRAIYPQEFLCMISASDDFEFIGWWNNWDLHQPLTNQLNIERPIALLRRL